jgi:hypothetical protein
MALNRYANRGIFVQPAGLALQKAPIRVADLRAIVIKVDGITDIGLEISRAAGNDRRLDR